MEGKLAGRETLQTQLYFTVSSRSDPGSHQSAISLAASHHATCKTESAFLTAAHSEKVSGEKARREQRIGGKIVHLNMFLLFTNIHLCLLSLASRSCFVIYCLSFLHLSVLASCPHLKPLTI